MDQIVFNFNMFFLSLILKVFRLYSAWENYHLSALRQKMAFDLYATMYGMALGLYKQLLGYLEVRVTLIKQTCFLLWWQMQEIATVLQFQV